MKQCILLVVIIGLISLRALAQKAEVFGGYQYTHLDPGINANGWNASATYNLNSFLGVTADFSGAYTTQHLHVWPDHFRRQGLDQPVCACPVRRLSHFRQRAVGKRERIRDVSGRRN